MKKLLVLGSLLAAVSSYPVLAAQHEAKPANGEATAVAADSKVDGEVRKVDKETGKVTVRHGELKNLDMPAMTMVFRVQDKALLDQLKPGDKIRFVAEKSGTQFILTAVEVKP